MDPTQIGLFSLAERRMTWLEQRQSLLAGNIANLDTPGYVPRDLPAFSASVAQAADRMARTDPRHLAPASSPTDLLKPPPARTPDGNAVSLDEQLAKTADTATAQELTTAIYRKYLAMFSLALGHANG